MNAIAPLGWAKALAPHSEPAGNVRTDSTHKKPNVPEFAPGALAQSPLPEPYRPGAIGNVLSKVA